MGDKKDAENKLEGHRKAIQEHIQKFRDYSVDYDKQFALKTIQRIQKEIEDIKKRFPSTSSSPLDKWKPLY